ncbi:hypothetical protein AB5I41_30945 [Sphingomonas sp. MMS24-JH45]
MGQAASLAPSLSATSQLPIQSLLSIAQAQQMPIQAAAGVGLLAIVLLGRARGHHDEEQPQPWRDHRAVGRQCRFRLRNGRLSDADAGYGPSQHLEFTRCQAPAPYMPPEPAAAEFKKPSTGALIAGVIGDTLSQVGGGQGCLLVLYRQQEMAAKARMEAAQRSAEYTDFTHADHDEIAHPKAVSNDTVNDYNFIAGKLGQGEADKYLRSVAAGPPVAIEGIDANGNQTRTLVPRSQAYGGSGPSTPPDGAVR